MKGIIINQDPDGIVRYIGKYDKSCTAEEIAQFPKAFEGSQVTDYFLCVFCTCTTFPSKFCTSFLDKYHQKLENGVPVDYTGNDICKGMHHVFDVLGVDHNEILIEGFKKIGINPWLSFRMNDFHSRNLETCAGFSDFYHEHPEVRRVKYHPSFLTNNGDRAYDYSYEIVREHIKSIIDEALDRYDPYGIELDYQRELVAFAHGMEYDGIEIMNAFMREIDVIVKKHEAVRGHQIKIAVRVAPDIQTNFDFGYDVMQWVRDGVVDMVIPSARYESNDNDMPIKLWSGLLEPYGVELIAGMDMSMRPYPSYPVVGPNIETFAAFAANAYSQGAQKIYLYNCFRYNYDISFDKDAPLVLDPALSYGDPQVYWSIINILGDPEKVIKLNRRHVLTYKDRFQYWEHGGGIGRQLPVTLSRSAGFKFSMGEIPRGAKLTLRIGVEDDNSSSINPPTVYVNSEKCEYAGVMEDRRWCAEGTLLCYSIPETAYKHNISPYIIVDEIITIKYVEVYVKVDE